MLKIISIITTYAVFIVVLLMGLFLVGLKHREQPDPVAQRMGIPGQHTLRGDNQTIETLSPTQEQTDAMMGVDGQEMPLADERQSIDGPNTLPPPP